MKKTKNPKRISTYFSKEIPLLVFITLSGILYNFGLLFTPFFQGKMIDSIKDQLPFLDVVSLILIFLGSILFVQVFRIVKRYTVREFANRTVKRIRHTLYDNILHKSLKDLEKEEIGGNLSLIFYDVSQAVEGMRKLTTEIFDTVFVFLFYIVYLMMFSVKITSISLLPIALSILLAFLLRKQIYRSSKRSKELHAKLTEKTYDLFENSVTYRLNNREEDFLNDYDETLSQYEKANFKTLALTDTLVPLCNLIALTSIVPILLLSIPLAIEEAPLSIPLVNIQETWTLGAFSTYFSTFILLASKASHTANLFSSIQKGLSSWKRIEPKIQDTAPFSKAISVKGDCLLLENFSLKTEERTLIQPISLSIEKGMIVGITGKISCGKSALLKALLNRFPYEGKIILFGKDLSSYTEEELAGTISYLGHQPELFTRTIRENIAFSKENDVKEILTRVQFDEDLQEMKEKEDTIVGQEGVKLSGGQAQRIALARTLYDKKDLILLDDPFSAVDEKTETRLFDEIAKEKENRIILMTSHRLKQFDKCNLVIVFEEDGKLSIGKHEEVKNNSPFYQTLLQKGEER